MAAENNKLLTSSIIAKESLRLLKNNLVMAPIVHRNLEKEYGKIGDTVSVKLPYRIKSTSGRVIDKKPMVDQTTTLVVDNQEHIAIEYVLKDLRLSIEQFSERYLKSGMSQIANAIDRDILLTLKNAFHSTGTPGTRPDAFLDFANAAAKQTMFAVPDDGMRNAVLNPFTCAGLSDEVTRLLQNGMVGEAYKNGYRGNVSRYKTHESQQVPTHTVGALGGTPLNDGAGANGTSVNIKGFSNSVTDVLLTGDVFTIAGVYSVNPQSYQSTGLLQEFVVQADASSDGTGDVTVTVSPSLNDGTATTTNADGDTISLAAYQNVSALPADGAAITVKGSASTEYEQNYLFHRDAVAFAMLAFEKPETAVKAEAVSDPDTGLSLLLTGAFDIAEHSETTRIDALWGSKLIYPELAMRMWGDNL